jgi:hypothetical protein
MDKTLLRIIVVNCLFFVQVTLSSCSTTITNPPIPVEKDFTNKQILLRAPDYANTFKTTESLALELKYNSTNEIKFPRNYNLRIFEYSDGEWIEIMEKPTERFPDGDIIFSPDKYMPIVQVVGAFPDLPDINQKYKLRIYVTGEMKTEEGNQDVVAYVDVQLTP